MSLIYFHIFLISVGIVFSLGFGIWELSQFSATAKMFDLITGVVAFIFSSGLLIYLIWFIRKKKPQMK